MSKLWLFIEPGRIGDWIISTAAVGYFIRDNSNSVDWLVRPEVVQILAPGLFHTVFATP